MAQPIRWDNVNGAGLSEAGRPLEAAQRSFLGAFDTVGNVLQQRQQMEDQNWQNTRTNNTNAFLDAIAKYRSPEELRAAQAAGGALDQLRQGFGNQIDANAIRGAADARVASLQQQAQQEVAYKHMMTDERVAPLADKFKVASQNADKAGMAAAQAEYEKLGGRDLAGLVSYADARRQQIVQRGRDTTIFDNTVRKANDEHSMVDVQKRVANANIAQSMAGVRASDSQVKYNNYNMDRQTKLDDAAIAAGRAQAAKQALREAGNMFVDGTWDGSQSTAINDIYIKNGVTNPDKRSKAIEAINELQRTGVPITFKDKSGKEHTETIRDIPVSAIISAANSAYDPLTGGEGWGWNTGIGYTTTESLKKILQAQYVDDKGNRRSKPADDLAAFNYAINKARENSVSQYPQRQQKQVNK